MKWKVLQVFSQDGHLILQVEHYLDESIWFTENYRWQGREGLRHKREVNIEGQFLMDNGEVAPLLDSVHGDPPVQYLSSGRSWKFLPGPALGEATVFHVIRDTHRQRIESGWPHTSDVVTSCACTNNDSMGVNALLAKFSHIVGYSE